jgi:hypothetical protein
LNDDVIENIIQKIESLKFENDQTMEKMIDNFKDDIRNGSNKKSILSDFAKYLKMIQNVSDSAKSILEILSETVPFILH